MPRPKHRTTTMPPVSRPAGYIDYRDLSGEGQPYRYYAFGRYSSGKWLVDAVLARNTDGVRKAWERHHPTIKLQEIRRDHAMTAPLLARIGRILRRKKR